MNAFKTNLNQAKKYFDLSLEALHQKNYAEAEKQLLLANALAPNRPSILINLSAVLIQQKKWEGAKLLCLQLLEIDPKNIDNLVNLGVCELHEADSESALSRFNSAIDFSPTTASAWANKGNILLELEKLDEANDCFHKALGINPGSEETLIGMGNLQNELMNYKQGIEYFDKALSYNPSNAQAQWNKALSLLRLGEFDEGWRLYESRWQIEGMQEYARNQNIPLWLGNELLNDKNILIHDEQGFGDTIQMARYLPILEKKLGANVFMEVKKPLVELMRSLSPSIRVFDTNTTLDSELSKKMDYQCPIMSLPLALKTTLNTIPLNIPYLFPDPTKSFFWQNRLREVSPIMDSNKKRLRIGLTWSGSGQYAGKRNTKRNLSFEQVTSLIKSFESDQLDFHAIQRDVHDSWHKCQLRNLFFHEHFLKTFADTAALVAEMELIVSIDTAVGHLAGALGQNVLLLIPTPPDFMSMTNVSRSPWYPKTKFLRQFERGVWSNEQIKNAIFEFIKS